MSSRLTYGMILGAAFILLSSTPCYAPTDWIVNAIDYANGLVKEASSVQEEYASYANNYVQGKIGSLGDVNSLKKKADKAKKLQDKYNKVKENYNKVKALADKAQEKKDALTKKMNDLKDKAEDIRKKYEDAKKKVEDVKDKIDEAKDKVEDIKDKVDDVKDKIDEVKDKVDEAKDKIDEVKDKVNNDTEKDNENNDNTEDALESQETPEAIETTPIEQNFTDISTERNFGISPQMQAATTMQALTSTENAVITNITLPVAVSEAQMETPLSAEEVLELSEVSDEETAAAMSPISNLSLEEQLLMSDQLKAQQRQKQATAVLTQEQLQTELKAIDDAKLKTLRESRRQSFNGQSNITKEAANVKE